MRLIANPPCMCGFDANHGKITAASSGGGIVSHDGWSAIAVSKHSIQQGGQTG